MKVSIVKGYELPEIREGNKDGKAWKRVTQSAYLHVDGPFPVRFSVPLESESHALPVGDYELSAKCLQVSKYGDLEFNRFEIYNSLRPVTKS